MDSSNATHHHQNLPARPTKGSSTYGPIGGTGAFPGSAADMGRVSAVRFLWNRRRIIGATVLTCVLAFGFYGLVRPKIYTRSCGLAIEPAFSKVLGEGFNMEAYLNTQADVIASSTAVHTLTLTILKERQDKGLITLETIGNGGDDLAAIRDGLTASPRPSADVIDLQFNSRHPEEAAYVLSALAEAYTRFSSADRRKAPTPDAYKSVLADKEKWDKEIHDEHSKVANIESDITLLQMHEANDVDAARLKSMSDQLTTARLRVADAKAAYERLAKSMIPDADRLNTLIESHTYNGIPIAPGHDEGQIKSELFAVRQRLNDLKERFLPNHPAVAAARAKVDEVTATYVLYLNREWTSADRYAKSLEAEYEDQKDRSAATAREVKSKLALRKEQLKEIRESMEEKKKLTDLLATRLDEATSLDQQSAVKISLLKEPDPLGPSDKVRPDVRMLLLEGLLAGLALGVTLATIDGRVRSTGEAAAAATLPVIGVVPKVGGAGERKTLGRLVHLDPMSEAAEAFRAIRSAIHFGQRGRTLLVTSSDRGEGKSLLAANLAIAMAEAGQRVLLLDANLRGPKQHEIFSAPNEVGVTDVVTGKVGIDQAIQATNIRFLELMPCGPVPFNVSETINNQMFADMLLQLGALYDYVVIDSPPVLEATDARILAAMSDATLMVVRAGRTQRRSVADARDGLLGFGANVMGLVVNTAPWAASRFNYGGGSSGREGSYAPSSKPTTVSVRDKVDFPGMLQAAG